MKKEIIKLALILGFLFSMYQMAEAQVIVKVKPVRSAKRVVKVKAPGRNHVWIAGHWKWRPALKKYVWVGGRWVKSRKNKVYVAGHWRKVPGGHMWVPGQWRRR